MCFSATASFSVAAILLTTGTHAVRLAKGLPPAYMQWALIPVLFAVQQICEGMVWLHLDAGNADAALPFALGFHFFSHFLWLWWLPLCSYQIEQCQIGQNNKSSQFRQWLFGGIALFGIFAGSLVYAVMLLHPEWMSVTVREHSLIYDFSAPYQGTIDMPFTPMMLYGLIILVPLLFSSHRLIRIFGVLVILSMALAGVTYNKAFVSVWCFFAAALSLYLVYMLRHQATLVKDS